ncbi:hypothetical protein [Alkalimarinus sediminis]|uniref:Uncharacterized protein n=1 Tax=Alkalimarinus sediminis TaxID=1632866 RepID=A0A9E8KNN7_9ALTE|nr:hypothetical protein [Alkalimarinus sediminis]UZW74558.1 hypothetical protein NNL22_16265 [Alkalimarinus sediminis]
MKVNQNINTLVETALSGLDNLGFQLDAMGITSQVNRHTLIGYVMAEQKHLEGELDSIKARAVTAQVKVEKTINNVEALVNNGVDLALKPAKFVTSTLKGFVGK